MFGTFVCYYTHIAEVSVFSPITNYAHMQLLQYIRSIAKLIIVGDLGQWTRQIWIKE